MNNERMRTSGLSQKIGLHIGFFNVAEWRVRCFGLRRGYLLWLLPIDEKAEGQEGKKPNKEDEKKETFGVHDRRRQETSSANRMANDGKKAIIKRRLSRKEAVNRNGLS